MLLKILICLHVFLMWQRGDPPWGTPLQILVSTSRQNSKNIQADPHIVHTTEQSKHSLPCRWPLSCPHLSLVFNVIPRVSWMVSSLSHWVADTIKQEETPAMTHNADRESRGEPGVGYIISSLDLDVEPDNNFMSRGAGGRGGAVFL